MFYDSTDYSNYKDDIVYIQPAIKHYYQGDPGWGKQTLGKFTTLGKSGCAVTCLAMLTNWYGDRDSTPATLDRYLDRNNGYVGDLVIWDVVTKYIKNSTGKLLQYKQIQYGLNMDKTVIEKLDASIPVILGINYDFDKWIDHFVLAIGYNADKEIIINDPGYKDGSGYDNPEKNTMPTIRKPKGYSIMRMAWFE